MPTDTAPAISLIMITDGHYDVCRRAMSYLRAQTVVGQIEMILVCPSKEIMQIDDDALDPFHSAQIIEIGEVTSTGQGVAAAVPQARGPYILYAEEHGFMPPDIIETMLGVAAKHDYAAYGWGMIPANPGTIAWAHIYGQFAEAVAPFKSREIRRLGGHHAMYRTSVLLEYDGQLHDLMGTEALLQELLEQRGMPLYIVGETASHHIQVSDFWELMHHEYLSQKTFAAGRVHNMNWGWGKRLVYIAGSPLIPFVRMARALPYIRRSGRLGQMFPLGLLVMICAFVAGTLGEVTGYLLGDAGDAIEKRTQFELHRFEHVAASDKSLADQHSPGRNT